MRSSQRPNKQEEIDTLKQKVISLEVELAIMNQTQLEVEAERKIKEPKKKEKGEEETADEGEDLRAKLTVADFQKLENITERINVTIKSLTEGTSLPQSKFDLVMDTYDLQQSQDILALLSRHEMPNVELKQLTPFVLVQNLGLVDANII